MGSRLTSHVDINENVKFDLNILVCGNYTLADIEKDLKDIKKFQKHEGKPYFKEGIHKYVKGWKYYLFYQDNEIGENTYKFIREALLNEDYNNVILFYSGLNEYTYRNLLDFYKSKPDAYHCNILIANKEQFIFKDLNLGTLDKNLIKRIEIGNDLDKSLHLIKVSSYCNQLGDEVGFPKYIIDQKLLEKDNQLMLKHLFTFNILLCGKPGGGKSTLINRILGEKKAFARKGSSTLTLRIVKYISDKYPIAIYDSPGFESEKDVELVQKLINQKNESLNEEKNRIHCVFYVLNAEGERTFSKKEFDILESLLNQKTEDQKMDVYFVITHAGKKENADSFEENAKLNIEQKFGRNKFDLKDKFFQVELEEKGYKRRGIKELFTFLHQKYEKYKYDQKITSSNIREINPFFFGDITTKDNLKIKLTALSQRVKTNFKILASTLENSPFVKGTTNLSTAVIKIVSKMYNDPYDTKECLDFITSNNFTNEYNNSTDKFSHTLGKLFDCIFYPNGPASKEVEVLASILIEKLNKNFDDEKKFYGFLNSYNGSINEAIDSLKDIND